ncbi:hypothetical protein FGIG_07111 [Fasciola gigantica]|uniref:Tetratricopeptide repeat protein n=1 Tax=Fasciola gigantica TaxID=46835 RepID=A0A504YLG1_FASGI|nr:hypothetical protein FGIG_07111 [Fasciola gigantica]
MAIKHLRELCTMWPNNEEGHVELGYCLTKTYEHTEALSHLTAALYINATNRKALLLRGMLLRRAGPLQALRDLTVCIQIEGKDDEGFQARMYRAVLFFEWRKYQKAINDLEFVYEHNPSLTWIPLQLGICHLKLQHYSTAVMCFNESLKSGFVSWNVYLCRAEAFAAQKKIDCAIYDLQRAINVEPTRAEFYLRLCQLMLLRDECATHSSEWKTMLEASMVHMSFRNLYQRALAHCILGQYSQAIELVEALTRTRTTLDDWLLLSEAWKKIGHWSAVVTCLQNAIRTLEPKQYRIPWPMVTAELLERMGLAQMHMQLYEEAVESFSAATHINPHRTSVYLHRGICRLRLAYQAHHLPTPPKPTVKQGRSGGHQNRKQNTVRVRRTLSDEGLEDLHRVIAANDRRRHEHGGTESEGQILTLADMALRVRAMYFAVIGRLAKAIKTCNLALKLKPKWTWALFYRGMFKFQLRTHQFAENDFTASLELSRDCAMIYYTRALCREATGKWSEALEDYKQVLSKTPQARTRTTEEIYFRSLINMGLIQARRFNQYEDSARSFHLAHQIYTARQLFAELGMDAKLGVSNWPELIHSIGLSLHRLGKFEQADANFRSLTLANPALTWAHVSRANMLMDYGGHVAQKDPGKQKALWTRALEEYQFAHQLSPTDWSARIGLAIYLQVNGKLTAALQMINEGLDNLGEQKDMIIPPNLFEPSSKTKKSNDMKAILTPPFHPEAVAEAYECRGLIEFQLGHLSRAIADLTEAIRLNPSHPNHLVNRGTIYQRDGQLRSAMTDYRRAISLVPNHGSAHFHRGLLYLLHGQVEQSELALGNALSDDYASTYNGDLCAINKDPAVWLTRAIARYLCAKHKQFMSCHMDGARQDLEQAEKLLQGDSELNATISWPHFHYAKGRFLFYLGLLQQSLEEFTKAIALIPDNAWFYRARSECHYRMQLYKQALTDYHLVLLAVERRGKRGWMRNYRNTPLPDPLTLDHIWKLLID